MANVGDVQNFNGVNWQYTGEKNNNNGWVTNPGLNPGTSSGGSSGGTSVAPFNFDWEKARQDAFNSLTPYYQQKLELAKGDVELAKRYIEEDYKRNLRYKSDTYAAEERYNQEQGANTLAQENIAQGQETTQAEGEANKRGTYVGEMEKGTSGAAPESGYYKQFIGGPMSDRQALRRQAIQRATQKTSELAGISKAQELGVPGGDVGSLQAGKNKALNEQDTSFRNYQLTAGQEQKQQAYNVNAPLKYNEEYSKYKAVNNIT